MRFVVRRLGFFLVTLWAAVTLNFLIPRLMPGNAAIAMMSRYKGHVNPQAMHALEIAFGVHNHQSLVSSYFTYLGNIARGHFGVSLTFFPDTVAHQVLQALPWTLALVGITTILAFLLGTLIGLVSGWRRGGALVGVLPPLFVITSAFPYFWLALLAIWLFSLKLGWFPESGGYNVETTVGWNWTFVSDAFTHSILPALTIIVTAIGGWILTMRNNMITVLTEDYVRTAPARPRRRPGGRPGPTSFARSRTTARRSSGSRSWSSSACSRRSRGRSLPTTRARRSIRPGSGPRSTTYSERRPTARMCSRS